MGVGAIFFFRAARLRIRAGRRRGLFSQYEHGERHSCRPPGVSPSLSVLSATVTLRSAPSTL